MFLGAVVAGAGATLLGFGVFDGAHVLGWLSLAATLVAAGLLVERAPRP